MTDTSRKFKNGDIPLGRMRVLAATERRERAASACAGEIWASHVGAFPRVAGHYVERSGGLEPQVLFCEAGAGWIENGGKRQPVRAGEAAWVDCSRPHRYGADFADPWSIVWAHIEGPGTENWQRRLTEDGRRSVWRVAWPGRVVVAFEEAWSLLESGEHPASSTALAHWLALLGSRVEAGQGEAEDGVLRIAQELRNNPQINPSVAEMARRAGCSPSHFLAKFSARWGMPPRAYLNHQRVQRACWMLEATDQKLESIAQECGLGGAFYFSRVFSKAMGMPPSAYRLARASERGELCSKGESVLQKDSGAEFHQP